MTIAGTEPGPLLPTLLAIAHQPLCVGGALFEEGAKGCIIDIGGDQHAQEVIKVEW
jgi:hypothetical protein